MDSLAEFIVRPIGIVEKGTQREKVQRTTKSRYQITSRIRIFDEFAGGLEGIDAYSHLMIIWLMHRERELKMKIKPWNRNDMPEVGIFSTRFPPRPNHIAISIAQLTAISQCTLTLRGLDAWKGSPVLDIKPYDYWDIVKDPKVPKWFKKFWDQRSSEKRYTQKAPWLGP
jgi:tRNA-Thr(GGU) m(6)t(6)A37 methyltransferase TsaA